LPKTISHLAISVDGFAAGPNQSLENPIGEGGMQLHQWMFETAAWARRQGIEPVPANTPDSEIVEHMHDNVGAFVMGRNMFSPGRGAWDMAWRGWWGEEPPYHAPVFVLTHHPREPLPMQGGTTFHFVTDGIESAMAQARAAAGDRDVMVAGGAEAVRQYLAAGEIDELNLHVAPIVLGSGERLFDGLAGLRLAPAKVVASKAVTHVTYRIQRPAD
jgi:dihydrofolate reductase